VPAAETRGVFGYVFVDLGARFTVADPDGDAQRPGPPPLPRSLLPSRCGCIGLTPGQVHITGGGITTAPCGCVDPDHRRDHRPPTPPPTHPAPGPLGTEPAPRAITHIATAAADPSAATVTVDEVPPFALSSTARPSAPAPLCFCSG